jgi:predicted outer membrane repeat protein
VNHTIITIINSKFIFNAANSSLYTLDQTAAGGAIYAVNNCSLFVYNSYFHNNNVYYGYRLGGSIAIYQGIMHISGSVLSNNRAEVGAAVYLSESMGVFNLSNITSSNAIDNGGALYSVNSSLNFDSILLLDNRAANGGGISMSGSTMIIQNSTFIRNFANRNGGVIYASMKSVLYIMSSQFKNNSAIDGAVIRIDSTQQELRIEECEFLYNRADANGGVFYFHILHTNIKANVNITQSKFISNKAMGNGGVIYCRSYNKLAIEESDNVYRSNHAVGNGGVMYISGSTLEASNAYFTFNTANTQEGIVSLSNCRVTYSTITFHKNLASAIVAIESEINFIGKVNFTANELEHIMDAYEEPKGSAVTSKFSILTFSGKGVFSNNKASSFGGAICSINSIVHVLGDTEFLNNRAIKGGGV